MWKQTVLTLSLIAPCAWAATAAVEVVPPPTDSAETAWMEDYQKSWQKRLEQREVFRQLMNVINQTVSQKKMSPATEQMVSQLLATLVGYPLQSEAEWAWLNAKIGLKRANDEDIQAFIARYPDAVYQKQLEQSAFERLYSRQKFAELIELAQKAKPQALADQCRLFSARYETAASQAEINPEVDMTAAPENLELKSLLNEFDRFWTTNPKLTSECANLESYWRDQGFKTDEKVRARAVEAVRQNVNATVAELAANATDKTLKSWLKAVSAAANNPRNLQIFAENQPLVSPFQAENKAVVMQLFADYLRSLPENTAHPSFETYQRWAEKYQLSPEEVKNWKVAFLNRFFDHQEPTFSLWRDEQIKTLAADTLTERRLRMAIWQQTDLGEWLTALSDEGKAKAEWRYWAAKTEKNAAKRKTVLENLAKERGFYPMLAAQQLATPYQIGLPPVRELSQAEKQRYQPQLERIHELRELGRLAQAKTVWIAFINSLKQASETTPTALQLAAVKYAKDQNWYDLAVEGTIQLKAFDYLDLRLPNAYSDWFDLSLKGKNISKSFAQAIARQESAWNPEAKSSANAMGLMQLLPTTAQKTARDNGLLYRGERDLFEPLNNILLGTTHLSELERKYPNNRILIASAYNAGAARVEQWLARSGKRLAMDEFIASIPFYETRGYVQNVLAYDYYYQWLYPHEMQSENGLKMFYESELQQKY